MLIDLHAHTYPISLCCRAFAQEVINTAIANGYDGMVLTNHYDRVHMQNQPYELWIENYINEYYNAKEIGEKVNFKVFLGAEITMHENKNIHNLIYGIDDDNFLRNENLFYYSQQQLYNLCKERGYALIQAHPFRNGVTPVDPKFTDGYEINCHPHKNYCGTHSAEIPIIANKYGLTLTCGSDYHADTYRVKGGTFFPDSVKTITDIKNYLLTTDKITLRVEEKDSFTYTDITYNLHRENAIK